MITGNKDIVVKKYVLRSIQRMLREYLELAENLNSPTGNKFFVCINCRGMLDYLDEITRED